MLQNVDITEFNAIIIVGPADADQYVNTSTVLPKPISKNTDCHT